MHTRSHTADEVRTPNALEHLMEAAGDVVFRLDRQGMILFVGARTTRLLARPHSLSGDPLVALVVPDDQLIVRTAILDAPERDQALMIEVRLHTPERDIWVELRLSRTPDDRGELLVVGRDMSSQKATEQHLRHLATHDALTELPNRLLLSDRIRMIIAQARRSGQPFSVAAIGLNSFKKVNDGLGHAIGDVLLKMTGVRLRKSLRESDTLARVGGDEFVAVLPGTHSDAQIKRVTGRLQAALQAPFEIDGHTIYVGASIGVALYPEHAEDEARLVALADSAMSRAKKIGEAHCHVYSEAHARVPGHDISLEAAMFRAVREGEFLLYFQPIVETSSRQIQGFETLMRWRHPSLGMVPPVRFIPIAESNGLINLLGAWALKAACVQLRQFEEVAKRRLYIAVNISPRQFRNDKFLDALDDAIAFSGLPGDQLVLEITEGTLMVDPAHAETILTRMTERHARIAIDDFGTGYSSLAYLKRFPISVLKIDRAFIKDLPHAHKDGAICSTVLDLARHLNLSVVAEGVETEEQLRYLDGLGCHFIQGYLTGKPMPAHVALAALKEKTYTALLPSELRPVVQ